MLISGGPRTHNNNRRFGIHPHRTTNAARESRSKMTPQGASFPPTGDWSEDESFQSFVLNGFTSQEVLWRGPLLLLLGEILAIAIGPAEDGRVPMLMRHSWWMREPSSPTVLSMNLISREVYTSMFAISDTQYLCHLQHVRQ